jgi:hypothetical protein
MATVLADVSFLRPRQGRFHDLMFKIMPGGGF